MKKDKFETFIYISKKIVKKNNLLLVEVKHDNNYNFKVFIDKPEGNITIDECMKISRQIEREIEDYYENFSLEVSSPGLTSPFKIREQYIKNKGKEIEILLNDGTKNKGILKDAEENYIVIKINNKKETLEKRINFEDIKKAKSVLKF